MEYETKNRQIAYMISGPLEGSIGRIYMAVEELNGESQASYRIIEGLYEAKTKIFPTKNGTLKVIMELLHKNFGNFTKSIFWFENGKSDEEYLLFMQWLLKNDPSVVI